jgi:hybrid cluster-associated redox disulfide protein
MYEVTKDTIIADIMMNAPETMPLFQGIGMHCMGCALASGETVEQACNAHGVEVESFIKKLNEFIATL